MKITSEQFLLNNINSFKSQYPGLLSRMDVYKEKYNWSDKYVYYPRLGINRVAFEVFATKYGVINLDISKSYFQSTMYKTAETAYMLANWRRCKKIYKFSPELSKILFEQADNTDRDSMQLPIEILYSLPHKVLFIEAPFDNAFGCMITIDSCQDGKATLTIMNLPSDYIKPDKYNPKCMYVPEFSELSLIEGKTIGECMDYDTSCVLKVQSMGYYSEDSIIDIERANTHQMRVVTLLLYLISQNADIQENKEQAKIYRKSNSTSVIKDKLREVEIMDVGFGVTVENTQSNNEWEYTSENNKIKLNWSHKKDLDEKDIKIIELEKMIKSLSKENDILKSEAYHANREVKELRQNLESIQRDAEIDRKELADLRELMFNFQTTNYIDETPNEDIHLPYYTNRNIVVFGGHNSWLTKIKPMLPNVRFIDRFTPPNSNIIKNADVVWIQNNSLSHSYYYSIVNIARKYDIPVRYCSYASSRKCAEQIVEEDLKQ